MSKEQIEEIAKTCSYNVDGECMLDETRCTTDCEVAKWGHSLVEGYRKQSEPISCDHEKGLILTIDGASGYFPKEFIIEAIKTHMSQSKGEWISVYGYERYSINEYGIVKNNETGMILLPIKNKAGYLTVCLYNEVKKTVRIHRLVAQAFIPNPENKPFINHKNGIKTDNRVCNLEWVTSSENNLHKCRVLGKKSTNEPNPKIAVRCVETGETFKSMSDASKKHKTQPIHISECCRGKRKTAGGLHWMPLPDAPKGGE